MHSEFDQYLSTDVWAVPTDYDSQPPLSPALGEYKGCIWDSPTTISPQALHEPLYKLGFDSIAPFAFTLGDFPDFTSDSSSDTVFSTPSSTSSTTSSLPPFDEEISDDADPASDYDDKDDGEYLPSPRLAWSTPQARRPQQSTVIGRRTRSESPTTKSQRKTPYSTVKRPRNAPPSRVRQADGHLAEVMKRALDKTEFAIQLNFECPDALCGFRMKAKPRMPDFRRHLKAHLRDADKGKRCICKGIPYQLFRELSEEQRLAITSGALGGTPYMHEGELMIGGCCQSFSRGDALTRHIKSRTNPCAGVVSGTLEGCL